MLKTKQSLVSSS